jgi:iron complex outermembrane receptor protein
MRRTPVISAVSGNRSRSLQVRSRPRAVLVSVAAAFAAMPLAYAADTDDSGKLEDIVVTAQKRAENLQEVPLAIQALSTQKLEELHVQSLDDYVKILPSVSIQRAQGEGGSGQPGTAHIFIRGITSGGDGNHSGPLPSVGTYLDEQPTTTIDGALDVHIYDIERVEVLEGPQGTLYGASSESGTIRVISNKPDTSKFSGAVDVSIDTVKHGSGLGHTEEGYINVPLAKNAAVRLVGWQEHDAGYIDNVAGTNASAGIVNGVRTFPTWDAATSGNGSVSNAPYRKNGYNVVDIKGGRGAIKVDLGDNWTVTPTVMAQSTVADGFFGYDPSIGDLQVTHFGPETSSDSFAQSALTIEGHVHDFDITYAGAYLKRNAHSVAEYSDYAFFYDAHTSYVQAYTDNAGNPINPIQIIYGDSWFTKMSQELRVTTPKRYPVKGTFGAFVQRQVHEIYQRYTIPGLADSSAVPGFDHAFYMADEERVDRDHAVFAQGTWDINPHWSLTAGLRQFSFDNSLDGFFGFRSAVTGSSSHSCGMQVAGVYIPNYRPFHGAPCSDLNGESKGTGRSPLFTVTFFGDNDLMAYGTISKGFRPGGVNRAVDPSTGQVPPPYKTEYLTNFELGWKSRWLDHHLRWNGAIFRENWKDFQFAHLGENSITLVSNAGGARINGLESDLDWSFGGGFVLSANMTFLDAKLTQDVCADLARDGCLYAYAPTPAGVVATAPLAQAGDRLPASPRFKGNLVGRYNFKVGDWKSNVQGILTHQTSVIPVMAEPEAAATGTQPGFSLFDLSAGAEHAGTSFSVFISNLFDTRAQLTRFNTCKSTVCQTTYIVPSQPRTIGFKFGQSF